MTAIELITRHEGLSLKPYLCPANKLSIGVGRNLEDNGISEEEALFMLGTDIARVIEELNTLNFSMYLNDARRTAMIDMLFNLGLTRFLKFRLMIGALENKDWNEAARQMLDSNWATQVGARAEELATIIKTGNLE